MEDKPSRSPPPSGQERTRPATEGQGLHRATTTQPRLPRFADAVPYSIVVVELEEGMATWVTDVSTDELRIGMPVGVIFDDVTPEITPVKFRSRSGPW